jgi:L-ascorbate metabolism protein UlaG (beta-lactamase superfamily)
MMKILVLISMLMPTLISPLTAQLSKFENDVVETSAGKLSIYFIGHSSLVFQLNGETIYTDPWSNLTDYSTFPKADLVLITHHHFDHLDAKAIESVTKDGTQLIGTKEVHDALSKGTIMKNGDKEKIEGIEIEAVPAYNTTEGRDKYHPKGRDNGYIITFGNKRVYVAGDTEDIPEMSAIKNIDIAFLPMNQPYTMTPEQVVKAVEIIKPIILYPYHYGDTDVSKLKDLLANDKNIDVRVRKLK